MGRYYFWLRLKAALCLCGELFFGLDPPQRHSAAFSRNQNICVSRQFLS